eukprot:NODE_41_length_34096_cov_2.002235.p31 type:complete len:116 gc:universal NODE_41_length_34096_cov_2.002235:18392-18045(-)
MMNQSLVDDERKLLESIVDNSTSHETPVKNLVEKISKELDTIDQQIGSSLNLVVPNPKGQITIGDLRIALKTIKHSVDNHQIDTIVQKFDIDKDGLISIEEMEKELNLSIKNKKD